MNEPIDVCVRPADAATDMEAAAELVLLSRMTAAPLAAAKKAADGARIGVALSGCTFCASADGDANHVRSWVAVRNGRVVGFASVTESLECLRLQELLVAPRERNRGVGAALLSQALDLAESFNLPISALVRETDVRGLRWLCDRGFMVARWCDGRVAIDRDAFPTDGVDGIALVRPQAAAALVRIAG